MITSLDVISLRVYPPPKVTNSRYWTCVFIQNLILVEYKHERCVFRNIKIYWILINQKHIHLQVRTWKYQEKASKRCVVFQHSHFSISVIINQNKSTGDIFRLWHLKIAQTILLIYETLNLAIWYVLKMLLAPEMLRI